MNQTVFKENIDGTEGPGVLELAELENKPFSSPTGYLVASQLFWASSVLEVSAVHPHGVRYLCWLWVCLFLPTELQQAPLSGGSRNS